MDDYAKLSVQKNLNVVAIKRARQTVESIGRALPCRVTAVSGAIVTVAFELDTSPWTLLPITIPKAESPWIRMPTQVGDLGVTMPADAYLGGVSGLGGGTAKIGRRGNLSTLVFVPVSNKGSPPDDQNAAQVCGPNGGIMRTTEGTSSSVVTNQSGTTITFGAVSLIVNATGVAITVGDETFTIGSSGATGTMPITVPDVILPNGGVNTHAHGGVESGSSSTDVMSG